MTEQSDQTMQLKLDATFDRQTLCAIEWGYHQAADHAPGRKRDLALGR
jgi:tRNA A37 threonylcarbamoyladenosine biosynthesis protein TsaE